MKMTNKELLEIALQQSAYDCNSKAEDLSPNVCAVYTDEAYRKQGIAGKLLNMAVEDMKSKGITPMYLVTDHIGFYERYGWEFLCMVQGCDPEPTRMYVHY